ncbi:MAG TPA: hypothetical protein ENN30_02710 [Candidatus Woesearchaeota archaeon]|nr:hypothetical protein [Candidatus Woesearchaeota archaeon]
MKKIKPKKTKTPKIKTVNNKKNSSSSESNTQAKSQQAQESKEDQEMGPQVPQMHQVLVEMVGEKNAEDVEKYTASVVQKFGRYIKSIAVWGSSKTKKTISKKTKVHDIDIAIIVDDTDVRRMTRAQLKDKLFQRLLEMGHPISPLIHPQPYLLTEFWQYVMDGNPVLYNVLRDGILIFDTGFFLPMQMLMKMGNIKPSKECIDKHIFVAEELLKLVGNTMLTKLTYDMEQSVVSSAQSVLMELGYRPPAPNEIPGFVEDVLVKEMKLVSEEYIGLARFVIKLYKDIEHKDKKDISGKELEEMKSSAEKFVKKMREILQKLRKEKGESFLYESVEKKLEMEKKRKVSRPTDVDLSREDPHTKADKIHEELGNR